MTQSKSIFRQLKNEHQEVKTLLEKAESCPENQRESVLTKIEENIVPHARGEEKTLYSLMRQRAVDSEEKESIDLSNEAYEEHRVADKLLSELKSVDVSDEKWLAHLKVLKENIEHHIEEEENELFSAANKFFSDEEKKEMLEDYLREKSKFSETLPTQNQIKERVPASR